MEYLYKYPQAAFPYKQLEEENRKRNRDEPEYEILDTSVFRDNRYFDILVTYAKQNSNDLYIKVEIKNRGDQPADLTVLPTLWFANKWGFEDKRKKVQKPYVKQLGSSAVHAWHQRMGDYYFYFNGSS
jgi:hypothetical protein